MGNEIKVNEYVRTRKGIIGILKQQFIFGHGVNYPEPQEWVIDVNGKKYVTTECDVDFDNIVKHSPNLIDLIKAEDTIKIKIGLYTSFVHFIVDEDDLISIRTQIEANFWILDEIYTKEMMESISYEVKE